ncbi:MAG: hypothetical protein H7259_04560 [Cytophagales bacterium]|nr:hypothetical protein [Cytophaga sp.]
MRIPAVILAALILPIYIGAVVIFQISLYGYWTDVIFSVVISLASYKIVFNNRLESIWLNRTLKIVTAISVTVVALFLFLAHVNPLGWDTFKMRGFYNKEVNNRIFNAYFSPVGAYAGGEGSFWITEVPKLFPIIEIERYYDRTILWNFRADSFDGKPVNQDEIVVSYIEDNIIQKEIKQ